MIAFIAVFDYSFDIHNFTFIIIPIIMRLY